MPENVKIIFWKKNCLSNFQIGTYLNCICSLDLLRIFVGRFPKNLCLLINILKGWFTLMMQFSFIIIFVFKFTILCVWKNMKVMDDFLLLTLFVGTFSILSLEICFIGHWIPGRLIMNMVIHKSFCCLDFQLS